MDAKTLQWIVNKALAKQQKQFTEQIKEMIAFQQKLKISAFPFLLHPYQPKKLYGALRHAIFEFRGRRLFLTKNIVEKVKLRVSVSQSVCVLGTRWCPVLAQ